MITKESKLDFGYEFFIKAIPRYAEENGPRIYTRRAFNALMGRPIGVHAGEYKTKINGVSIHSMAAALRRLHELGMVKPYRPGVWIWTGNGGNNDE